MPQTHTHTKKNERRKRERESAPPRARGRKDAAFFFNIYFFLMFQVMKKPIVRRFCKMRVRIHLLKQHVWAASWTTKVSYNWHHLEATPHIADVMSLRTSGIQDSLMHGKTRSTLHWENCPSMTCAWTIAALHVLNCFNTPWTGGSHECLETFGVLPGSYKPCYSFAKPRQSFWNLAVSCLVPAAILCKCIWSSNILAAPGSRKTDKGHINFAMTSDFCCSWNSCSGLFW